MSQVPPEEGGPGWWLSYPSLPAPRCDACRYWVKHNTGHTGTCHRYPPAVLELAGYPTRYGNPVTAPGFWCGEFKLKPVYPRAPKKRTG